MSANTLAGPWFVYIIETTQGHFYTGITTHMVRRWQQHCSGQGGARYFRAHTPARLCFLEGGHNRSSASQREAQIKKLSHQDKMQLAQQQDPTQLPTLPPPASPTV